MRGVERTISAQNFKQTYDLRCLHMNTSIIVIIYAITEKTNTYGKQNFNLILQANGVEVVKPLLN